MARPRRGEVWLVDLGLAAKVRPCLILSVPAEETDRALVTVVPHTTSQRGSSFEVVADTTFLQPGAFDIQSLVTVPSIKPFRKPGELSPIDLARIGEAVRIWLGL